MSWYYVYVVNGFPFLFGLEMISKFCKCGKPRRKNQRDCIECHREWNKKWWSQGRRSRKDWVGLEKENGNWFSWIPK